MGAHLTREHVAHLHHRAHALHKRVENLKARTEEMTGKFIRTLEVSAGAIAGGVIQGRAGAGGASLMGVPIDLGGGLALNLLGYFGVAGKHSDHLNNLGDGLLGAYLSQVGFTMGQNLAAGKPLLGAGAPAAAAPTVAGALTPGDVARIMAFAQANQGAPVG